jgi:hypothetical protein
LQSIIINEDNSILQKFALQGLASIADADCIPLLLDLIGKSANPSLRRRAAWILQSLDWRCVNEEEQAYFHIAAHEWTKVIGLGFKAIGPVNHMLSINDYREPEHAVSRDQLLDCLDKIVASITEIHFGGNGAGTDENNAHDSDLQDLILPMKNLAQIVIHAETCDQRLVERFITYAVNHLEAKFLKKKVRVLIIGDVEKLDRNLLNMLRNTFAKIGKAGKA